jgi:ATP-dependent DNA ligase
MTSTADGLLRHTVYVGLREDKPPDRVRRES